MDARKHDLLQYCQDILNPCTRALSLFMQFKLNPNHLKRRQGNKTDPDISLIVGSESADEKSMAVTEEGETYSEWLELRYLKKGIWYLYDCVYI